MQVLSTERRPEADLDQDAGEKPDRVREGYMAVVRGAVAGKRVAVNDMNNITLKPIGVIHTPFKEPKRTPIQPSRSGGAKGKIEIFNEFARGLVDLDGFSDITLLYYFHLSSGFELMVMPFLDNGQHGLFATRAPRRPNPIGLSVVRLERIVENVLHISDVDMVDGTPLLDIKPYVPQFHKKSDTRIGWLEGKANRNDDYLADERFQRQ